MNTYFAIEPLFSFIGCQFEKQFRSEFTCFRVDCRVVHGFIVEKVLETTHVIEIVRQVALQESGTMIIYRRGEQPFLAYRNSSA